MNSHTTVDYSRWAQNQRGAARRSYTLPRPTIRPVRSALRKSRMQPYTTTATKPAHAAPAPNAYMDHTPAPPSAERPSSAAAGHAEP